jgi:hypothetical protein
MRGAKHIDAQEAAQELVIRGHCRALKLSVVAANFVAIAEEAIREQEKPSGIPGGTARW